MANALLKKMTEANTYDEWKAAAIAYDERSGGERWKRYETTSRYDNAEIRRRLDRLEAFRSANDNHGLLYTLNEGIHGNMGGMGNSRLYGKAKFGTKHLIVDYVNEVTSSLEHLSQPRLKGVSVKDKKDFFDRASLCFGRSALLMSGAGTYLFFHVGVLKALWEQNLIPEVISGSSGGAFVAAVVGTRAMDEREEIFDPKFLGVESELRSMLSKFISPKLVEVSFEEMEDVVKKLIPDLTFEEAYKLSGIHINISIAPAETHQKSRLLNSVTSPNVMVREAVLASCSIPGVFPPVTLAARNVHGERVPYIPSRKWVDGSLSDDLPMKRLSRLYGVNHFIVSQTNPIVVPFISAENPGDGLLATLSQTGFKTIKDWGLATAHLLQKPLNNDSYFSKMINGYISVVSQTYTGDITILPGKFLNPARALVNRTNEEIFALIKEGERATWPKLEQIRVQTKISRVLWRIIDELDNRMLKVTARNEARKKLKVVKKG
ncbi:MAG: DUF3336 domain-containing protein [Gammaproteobacteria bacterium]|nr:DUF3336 domain-containing protein [Gammaproteobacteria bacterium]